MITLNSAFFVLDHDPTQGRFGSPMNKFRWALIYVVTTQNIVKKRCIFFETILYLRTHWAYPLGFGIKLKGKLWATLWFMFKFCQTGGEPPSSLNMQKISVCFRHPSITRLLSIRLSWFWCQVKGKTMGYTMIHVKISTNRGRAPQLIKYANFMKKIPISIRKRSIAQLLFIRLSWFWYWGIEER